MSRTWARIRSLLRGLLRRSEFEAEMQEEFRHHIEMRTEDLMRRGVPRREAARRAHREFGHVEALRDCARASRGLHVFDQLRFSWIDVRLGLRMLMKYPVLTLVSGFALAVGIPVGLAPMHLANAVEAPLPEDPENRIRAIRLWDPATTGVVAPGPDDFRFWSETLSTFSSVGAFQLSTYNVASDDGRAAAVAGARVTASTFGILAGRPLLGRTLDAADESAAAPDVVVIGHDLWRSRFGSDPGIIGRRVRVGQAPLVVVGVMPEGFLFPYNHQLWLPLRDVPDGPPDRDVRLGVFGRLADGVSAQEAQAEVAAVRPGMGDGLPESRARLQPEVVPFGMGFIGLPRGGLESLPEFFVFQALALVLLLIACGNVAMLVFARTATRFSELAVRTALGASRGRILSQIFVETAVLAVLAAGVGVFGIDWMLGHVNLAAIAGESALPYWLSLRVTGHTLAWALVLAAGSATVAGVVPALRITGRKIQQSIQRAGAGRSGIRFGGVTGALIVADIALSVTVVGFALALAERMTDRPAAEVLAGIPAEEFLAVAIRMPIDPLESNGAVGGAGPSDRLASAQRALVERLQAEPGVRSVAVADALPRMDHRSRPIEVEGAAGSDPLARLWVRTARVDVGFLEALSSPILAGRDFDRADLDRDTPPVIVNTVFVERLLGGRDPIGRRVRFSGSEGTAEAPWFEIVGVVGHLGANMVNPAGDEVVYVPAAPGEINPVQFGLHIGGAPEAMAPRVRQLVEEVDPGLVVSAPVVLSSVYQGDWYLSVGVAVGLLVLVGVLLVLASSGIYAMMSFSVSERTREIGIRAALGASRRALVLAVLRRSLVQIGVGAALGLPLAARVFFELRRDTGEGASPVSAILLAMGLAVGVVSIVALSSCLVPTRRVLGIAASVALRAEG
jgi:predicted permease